MTDRSTTTPHPAGIRAIVGRRPVAAFLIMAFAIAYPVMALPALAVHRVIPGGQLLDRLPFPPDEIAGLTLTMFALLPSALFVTWAADGRQGIVSLFKRITRWRRTVDALRRYRGRWFPSRTLERRCYAFLTLASRPQLTQKSHLFGASRKLSPLLAD